MGLRAALEAAGISQTEFANGIGVSQGFVSRLLSGETGASQATVARILPFLAARLGRPVSYEELWPAPATALVEPDSDGTAA